MLIEDAFAQRLKDLGFGNLQGEANEHIFTRYERDEVDDTITVFADGGGSGQRQLTETHALTIRTRNVDDQVATEEASRIDKALHDTQGLFGTIRVGRVIRDTPPIPLGWDESDVGHKGRWIVTQSYTALVKRFTTP